MTEARGSRPRSPQAPPDGLVRVGHIGRVHGIHGELGLVGSSLTAEELQAVRHFTWHGRGEPRELTLVGVRPVHGALLVSFEGVRARSQALDLVRGELMVRADQLPDPGPDVVYTFQLIGLKVQTEEGRVLGDLVDVIATGAHPIYVVQGERELLVPATGEVLRKVDLEARTVTVALPQGLEEI